MDEILKSEVLVVVCDKKDGVSLNEFGGLFRQIHGYNFNLPNYGYSSLRKLLNDMNDLVELTTINGQHMIKCKEPSRHHVVVSFGINSQAKEQVSGFSSVQPSSGLSLGPAARKTEQAQPIPLQLSHVKQVYTTNSVTDKKVKEASKSKCSLPAKKNDSAVTHRKNAQARKCGLSFHVKTVTINEKTKKDGFSAKPNHQNLNSIHTRPSRKIAIATEAAKTINVSKISQGSISKCSHPKSERNLASFQNVSSAKTESIENKAFLSTTGSGIRPNVSYASICTSNANKNQFNDSTRQFTANNIKLNVDNRINSSNVAISYPTAEPRVSIHSASAIKNNILVLLNKHSYGLSVFQLQKLYLFMFQQPLRFKGLNTMKHLLLELKDVVRTEGIGVQMLVFPVSAENNPSTAANGNHDWTPKVAKSLLTNKYCEKEVGLYPHSSDPLKTPNDKLQEAAKLSLHGDQILTSGQQLQEHSEGHCANILKTEYKPLTLQNIKYVETPFNLKYDEALNREELSVPSSVGKVLPKQIIEKSQFSVPLNTQTYHKMSKNNGVAEISYLCKNETQNKATSQKEPSQNAYQDNSLSHLILHSSGFSVVMGQQTNGSHNTGSETNIVEMPRSLSHQRIPYHSNRILKQLQQMPFNTNSSLILQDTKPHQLSVPHEQNTNHLLLLPHNSIDTIKTCGQIEGPDLQNANNCSITEYQSSHSAYNMQSATVPAEIKKESSIQEKCSYQNRRSIEQENLQEEAPSSNTVDNVSHLTFSEEVPDVQNKKAIQTTSQHEARGSPPTTVLGKGNTQNLFEHNSEQVAQTLSDAYKVDNKPALKTKQDKLTVQAQQVDECINLERIAQCDLLSLGSRQDIVDLPQSIPHQPKGSVPESELQKNLERVSEQGDLTTWQTSQAQTCCIL